MKDLSIGAEKAVETNLGFFAKHKKLCIGGAVAAVMATGIGVAAKVLGGKGKEYIECGTTDYEDTSYDNIADA